MADDVDGPAPGEALASRLLARLSELGRELLRVAAPVAAYVPVVRTGRYVQTSGQLPFVDGALPATGKVGAVVSLEQAAVINGASELLGEVFGQAAAHSRAA